MPSHLHLLTLRATRLWQWSRRRHVLAALPVTLLLALIVAFSGCASTQDEVVAANENPEAQEIGRQDPVRVKGVESCRVLARLVPHAPLEAATAFPSLSLPCLTRGPDIDLSRMRGKPALVNLWASWCGPCRKEMPILQAAYHRYGDQVQFVGLDTRDSADSAAKFLHEVGVTYPQLADSDAVALKGLRIPGLPVTVILRADGSLYKQHIGAFKGSELETLLDKVAAGS